VTSELKSIVGKRVRGARKAAGLTQAQLAEAVNRTTEAVSNIERGKSLPSLEVLQRIAGATGSSLVELVAAPGAAGASGDRAGLEAELFAIGRRLSTGNLRIAVQQLRALETGSGTANS